MFFGQCGKFCACTRDVEVCQEAHRHHQEDEEGRLHPLEVGASSLTHCRVLTRIHTKTRTHTHAHTHTHQHTQFQGIVWSGEVIRWYSLIRNLCECGGKRLVLACYFLLYLVHILMLKCQVEEDLRHQEDEEGRLHRLAVVSVWTCIFAHLFPILR